MEVLMTEASVQALQGLRDLTTLKWYVIPLLSIVLYIYTIDYQWYNQLRNLSKYIFNSSLSYFDLGSYQLLIWRFPGHLYKKG